MTKYCYSHCICTIFMSLRNPPGSHWVCTSVEFPLPIQMTLFHFSTPLLWPTTLHACRIPSGEKQVKSSHQIKPRHVSMAGSAQALLRHVCTRFSSCCRELSYASNRSCILTNSLGTSCLGHNMKCHLIRAQMQKVVISGSLQEVTTIKIP